MKRVTLLVAWVGFALCAFWTVMAHLAVGLVGIGLGGGGALQSPVLIGQSIVLWSIFIGTAMLTHGRKWSWTLLIVSWALLGASMLLRESVIVPLAVIVTLVLDHPSQWNPSRSE